MAMPSEQQLLALITESADVRELDERVAHQFGPANIPVARLLAVQVCGPKWVFGPVRPSSSEAYKVFRVLGRPQNLVILVACAFSIVALLWPPFVLHLQDGGSWHMGFFSIFADHSAVRHGSVNVLLLLLEIIVIAAVGACAYILALRIEQRSVQRSESAL